MRQNQKVAIGAIAGVLLVSVVAAQFVPPIFVVLVLVLLGLGVMVALSRRAEAQRIGGEERWESADEWGLPTEEDDENVDVGGRLQEVGLSDSATYLEQEVVEEYVVYETADGLIEDLPYDAEVVEEYVVYETADDLMGLEEHVEEDVAADRFVDEAQVQDDESILAAAQASAVQYEDVLSREDANAETREILSRVASLLAKYE